MVMQSYTFNRNCVPKLQELNNWILTDFITIGSPSTVQLPCVFQGGNFLNEKIAGDKARRDLTLKAGRNENLNLATRHSQENIHMMIYRISEMCQMAGNLFWFRR